MTENIGEQGQLDIVSARVMIVGMGGLGCAASQYLAASGIGSITLIDHDVVEISNLQRQVLFTSQDIGEPKVCAAQQRLKYLNPLININAINQSVLELNLSEQLKNVDIVLDCTDNATTRHFINSHAVASKIKLVSASAIQCQGQLVSFDFSNSQSPCYECLFPNKPTQSLNCSTSGVLSPLLGVMGSLQAIEVIRMLLNKSTSISELITFDAWGMIVSNLKVKKEQSCKVCCNHLD
ncbi:HesA/MoeB/ThiF family protein [Psychrosphaera haliotis]